MCEELFGMSKEKFLKQIEKYSNLENANDNLLFILKKDGIKDIITPIRKYLKYKKIEDIEVNIHLDSKRIKNIVIYFMNPESLKQDPEKRIVIYSKKIYVSKTLESYNGKFYTKTFESQDKELESNARPFFNHVVQKLNEIFDRKATQNETAVGPREVFKRRILF